MTLDRGEPLLGAKPRSRARQKARPRARHTPARAGGYWATWSVRPPRRTGTRSGTWMEGPTTAQLPYGRRHGTRRQTVNMPVRRETRYSLPGVTRPPAGGSSGLPY
jgi:hypothetical protein